MKLYLCNAFLCLILLHYHTYTHSQQRWPVGQRPHCPHCIIISLVSVVRWKVTAESSHLLMPAEFMPLEITSTIPHHSTALRPGQKFNLPTLPSAGAAACETCADPEHAGMSSDGQINTGSWIRMCESEVCVSAMFLPAWQKVSHVINDACISAVGMHQLWTAFMHVRDVRVCVIMLNCSLQDFLFSMWFDPNHQTTQLQLTLKSCSPKTAKLFLIKHFSLKCHISHHLLYNFT